MVEVIVYPAPDLSAGGEEGEVGYAPMQPTTQSHYRHSPPVSGANDNTTQEGHKTSRSGQCTRRPERVVRTTEGEACCGGGGTDGGGAAGMS